MGQIAVKFIYIIAIDNVVLGYIGYHVNIKIVICLIIGLAAFGCAGYFLIRSWLLYKVAQKLAHFVSYALTSSNWPIFKLISLSELG